jgi:hypothetical protein
VNTPSRLAVFALAAAGAFGAGAGVGALVGPIDDPAPVVHHDTPTSTTQEPAYDVATTTTTHWHPTEPSQP